MREVARVVHDHGLVVLLGERQSGLDALSLVDGFDGCDSVRFATRSLDRESRTSSRTRRRMWFGYSIERR